METTNKMVCVLGRTCAGKDSLVTQAIVNANLQLANPRALNKPKYEFIVSYTTRPKRSSEVDGREHFFITEDQYFDEYGDKKILAYTTINGYRYFSLLSQVEDINKRGNIPVYIIDPDGLSSLVGKNYDIDMYNIYITASEETRLARYVYRSNPTKDTILEIIREFNKRNKSENEQFKNFESYIFQDKYYFYGINLVIFNEDNDKFKLNLNTLQYALEQFALK